MNHLARVALIASALSLGLSGCTNFDPSDLMPDWFNSKKRLPGDRAAVFPDGVPGVSQGVPPELVKGAQPAPDAEQPDLAAQPTVIPAEQPKPKAKPKPKPKTVAKRPAQEAAPTSVTVRPSQNAPQPMEPAPQSGTVQWPDPPPLR
jgi:hypothetical protein